MTTATCHRPSSTPATPGRRAITLPLLESTANPNPLAPITGPRSLASVQMLRISVTDVCNLRCLYCMPEEGVEWLPKSQLLTFEEIAAVVRTAAAAGITHFKLTGGEPTARRDLPTLVEMLRKIPGVEDLSLTTNGILLAPLLDKLKAAGLNRLTISLDSLKPERFATITRGGDFNRVWTSIEKALALGFQRIKINVVVMKGMNEDEVADFAALTLRLPITVRFIEFMPLGRSGLTDDPLSSMTTEAEIRRRITEAHGPLTPIARTAEPGVGPANIWTINPPPPRGGDNVLSPSAIAFPLSTGPARPPGRLGFISAMSHPFCDTCNRLRLTPEGLLRSCLFDGGEVDLKPILRNPDAASILDSTGNLQSPHAQLLAAFTTCVTLKPATHSFHGNKAMNRIGG